MTDDHGPGVRHPVFINEITKQLQKELTDRKLVDATSTTARESEGTRELIAQLVASQVAADAREVKMLFWTRVAGIGAVLALAVAIVGIIVTILAS